MNFFIGLILLVSSVSSLNKIQMRYYVNVVNADKNPPDRICGGVLVESKWALSSCSCVESLFKISPNVIITAGHSPDKEPRRTIKVTKFTVGEKVQGASIVALHLEKPITMTFMVMWARLPDVDFRLCKDPQAAVFQPTIRNDTSSGARKVIGFLLGLIITDDPEPVICRRCPPYRGHRGNSNGWRQYDPPSEKGSGPRTIKVKRQKQECPPSTGGPLMCGLTVAGIEIGCKRLNENEVESEYVSVYHYMKDIGLLLYQHKEIPSADQSNQSNQTDDNKDIAPPIAEGVQDRATLPTSEASFYRGIWKQVVLFALTLLFCSNRIH